MEKSSFEKLPVNDKYQYLQFCEDCLNNAWNILQTIKIEKINPLILPAFRFALVEYSKPYGMTTFSGASKQYRRVRLPEMYIPIYLQALHKEIFNDRNKIHAHSDIDQFEEKLSVGEFETGELFTLRSKNAGLEHKLIPKIDDIIQLIELTLDGLYKESKELKTKLVFTDDT